MTTKEEEAQEDVSLVVADVDGALVTPDKVITSRARSAVRKIESIVIFYPANALVPVPCFSDHKR